MNEPTSQERVAILEIDLPRPVGTEFMLWLGRQAGR